MYCMKCIVCITISQTILLSHPQQKINLVKEHEKLAKKSNKKTTIKKKKDTATTSTKKNTHVASPTKRKVVVKKKQRGKVLRTARRNSSGFEMLSQAAELHELQSSTLIAKIGVSSSEPPKYYTAKDNDTPLGIAKTFEVPIYKLIRVNKERYPSLLSRSRLIAGTLIQVSHLDKPIVETKLVKVKVTVGSTSMKKQKKSKPSKKKNTADNGTVTTATTRSSRRITVDKSNTASLEDTAAVQEDIDEDDADATTSRKMDNKIDDIPNDSISDDKDGVPQEACASSTSFAAGNRGETFDSGCTTATSTNEDESEAAEDYRLFNEEVLNFNWNEQAAMPQAQQGHVAASVSHDSAVTTDDQAASQLFSHHNPMVSYNKSVYDQILATLTAHPDFNNINEYQIKNDGLTRTALSAPALMRSRIKSILQEHLSSAWWKNRVLKSSSINECSHRVESLIALAVVMHDNPTWTCVGNTDVVDNVFTADNFTISMFDDEDEVLCISQMFANVWERVDRSLSRDNFSMLGVDGLQRGSVSMLGVDGLQRGSAMRRVMKTLVASAHMIISGLA